MVFITQMDLEQQGGMGAHVVMYGWSGCGGMCIPLRVAVTFCHTTRLNASHRLGGAAKWGVCMPLMMGARVWCRLVGCTGRLVGHAGVSDGLSDGSTASR
jgi:hypothetical protein